MKIGKTGVESRRERTSGGGGGAVRVFMDGGPAPPVGSVGGPRAMAVLPAPVRADLAAVAAAASAVEPRKPSPASPSPQRQQQQQQQQQRGLSPGSSSEGGEEEEGLLTVSVKRVGMGDEPYLTLTGLSPETTVSDLKRRIYEESDDRGVAAAANAQPVPPERQRLIFSGRMLTDGDDELGDDVKMKPDGTNFVHLVPIPEGKSLSARRRNENKSPQRVGGGASVASSSSSPARRTPPPGRSPPASAASAAAASRSRRSRPPSASPYAPAPYPYPSVDEIRAAIAARRQAPASSSYASAAAAAASASAAPRTAGAMSSQPPARHQRQQHQQQQHHQQQQQQLQQPLYGRDAASALSGSGALGPSPSAAHHAHAHAHSAVPPPPSDLIYVYHPTPAAPTALDAAIRYAAPHAPVAADVVRSAAAASAPATAASIVSLSYSATATALPLAGQYAAALHAPGVASGMLGHTQLGPTDAMLHAPPTLTISEPHHPVTTCTSQQLREMARLARNQLSAHESMAHVLRQASEVLDQEAEHLQRRDAGGRRLPEGQPQPRRPRARAALDLLDASEQLDRSSRNSGALSRLLGSVQVGAAPGDVYFRARDGGAAAAAASSSSPHQEVSQAYGGIDVSARLAAGLPSATGYVLDQHLLTPSVMPQISGAAAALGRYRDGGLHHLL